MQNSPHRGAKLKSVIVAVCVCAALCFSRTIHEVADEMVANVLVVPTVGLRVTWEPKTENLRLWEVYD